MSTDLRARSTPETPAVGDRSRDGSIVVLQSFRDPRPTTNPYLIQLADRLRATDGVRVVNFSWRAALIGRYDVFHVHWPEILVNGNGPVKKLVRQALTLLIVLRLRIARIPIVRTQHNVGLPDGISRRERTLLRLIDRWTTLRIALNDTTPLPAGGRSSVIPHGDYRTWFADLPVSEHVPGRIGYVGLIRRYKGVETLAAAFGDIPAAEGLSLRIGGKPSSEDLAAQLRAVEAADPRVSLQLEFLSDAALVDIVTASELVVLPYRFMHNSGTVLAALSLGRPVLVPDNEVNRRLADEVGSGWLHFFSGELDADALLRAVTAVRSSSRTPAPDLRRRDWSTTGEQHRAAYLEAVAAVRPRRAAHRGVSV